MIPEWRSVLNMKSTGDIAENSALPEQSHCHLDRASVSVGTVFAAGVLMCVAGALFGRHFSLRPGREFYLISASTGTVLLGAYSVWRNRSLSGIITVLALVCCWLGDYSGSKNFHLTVVFFAAAHGALISAFLLARKGWTHGPSAILAGIAGSTVISLWLFPHVGAGDRIAVTGYIVVITAMVVCALSVNCGQRRVWIPAALLFYISDIAVARWRFVSPGPENAFFCYPLYYAACLLFAVSPLFSQKR